MATYKKKTHESEMLVLDWFVNNRSTIEMELDYLTNDEKKNLLLLSYVIFKTISSVIEQMGRENKYSEEINMAAASLSYEQIMMISASLVSTFQAYRTNS